MRRISSIILGALVVTSLSAQVMTLRDMAAQAAGKPIVKAIGTEEPGKTMASLAPAASLIVHGTVRPLKTYLSNDGTLIYTDFECTPVTVIARRTSAQRTPGP